MTTFLDGHKANFETLRRALKNDDVAMLQCKDTATGKDVAVLCVVWVQDDGTTCMVPLARMVQGLWETLRYPDTSALDDEGAFAPLAAEDNPPFPGCFE